MEETPHLVAHFMASGAEQRLEDYHFLKNTYETISGQEVQLNRILRMLDEDEIALNWHIDTTPIDRARSRSVHDFDRGGDHIVLPGRIAYERLREMEKESMKKPPVSSYRNYGHKKRFSEQHERQPVSNGNEHGPSAARLKALAEYEAELAEADAKRQQQAKENQNIELISLSVRYENSPNQDSSSGRLVCEWVSPSPSSGINYYTIERQLGDNDWSSIGKQIDNTKNTTELNISSLTSNTDNKTNDYLPSRFRLKAHLANRRVFTSKPTDEIYLDLIDGKRIIIPDVEILSPNSVQLTWKYDDSEQANLYDIEKKDGKYGEWSKVTKVQLAQGSAQLEDLTDTRKCHFRLVPAAKEEPDLLTIYNVNELLNSLRLAPTSPTVVDVDISEEGFKDFDQYKVEYTTTDQLDQWQQIPNITSDLSHLTVTKLKPGTDYKFRFTPILRGATTNDAISSQLSMVLDVQMPSTRKGRLVKNEVKVPVPPPEFAMHHTDPTTVLIEAIVPMDKPASFEDVFDVYSKKETSDEDWIKVGTIDKDHLNVTIKNLEDNTAYAFKIKNQSSSDEQLIQEFKFETASVKLYDPSLFLERIGQGIENVVNGVMRAAAGHQAIENPVNISLTEVIKEVFQDPSLVPNEQYGFDTLALGSDFQLFLGPKQMLLQELEGNETNESSKNYGEIIIHNYYTDQNHQPVIVREDSGNTRIGNIDGDIILRNVVSDVLLINEETRNQLAMNIVGQAFLKGVQGVLLASNFKGIILVKNVNKP